MPWQRRSPSESCCGELQVFVLTSRIIRDRRRQANFQLIVITHDEGFLNRLAAHDVLEYYW
jgi:hypothetical protein